MPRYFFHVHDVAASKDNEGEVLRDDEAAWREAVSYAGALLNDINGKFRPGQEWSLEVSDAAGRPVFFIGVSSRRMR
ncbi:hypothetical protein SE91_04410 [Bradyrhizobium sp. DOA1]|nr:hypothetical protein SE91_04410 [Bradyrhizobium sp. DOA1]